MKALEEFMLPCLNKKLFGFDCLGCGMQRSLALIFRGDFMDALIMYPAIYSLLLLGIFLIFNLFMSFRYEEQIKKWGFIFNISIILISYIFKLIN